MENAWEENSPTSLHFQPKYPTSVNNFSIYLEKTRRKSPQSANLALDTPPFLKPVRQPP